MHILIIYCCALIIYIKWIYIIIVGPKGLGTPTHFNNKPKAQVEEGETSEDEWGRPKAAGRHRRGLSRPRRIGIMEGKSSTPSKATLPVIPNEGTNTGGQLWGHGGGAIIEEAVTSALNARSWQSGRINEEMTPEQCHLVCYNSQQVEESAGWDRYSSSDLHDQQMDGQDEWSRRIYNNRDLTRKRGDNRSS